MLVEVAHEYHPDRAWGPRRCSREKEPLREFPGKPIAIPSPASRRSLPGPKVWLDVLSGPGFFVAPARFCCILCRLVRGGELPEKFQDLLQAVLRDDLEVEPRYYITSVRTFADAGVPSEDRGLVVTMSDGSEYQITITRSR
jgi:hypothetical protein